MASVGAKLAVIPPPAPKAKTLFSPERFRILQEGRIYRRVVAKLPAEYQKFFEEWQQPQSRPIHWIPRTEKWTRNPETGEVKVVQNCPIPVKYPHQSHKGIWGGEGVIEGLVKKAKYRSPVTSFWVPKLEKSVVYSEILDKHFSVIVTETTHQRINEFEGFDSYLIKSTANDLQSLLALKIKRRILQALMAKEFSQNDPLNQQRLLEKYKDYMLPAAELEWYGLSVNEAQTKFDNLVRKLAKDARVPLKYQFRRELLERLQEEKANPPEIKSEPRGVSALMSKLNPFTKPSGILEPKST